MALFRATGSQTDRGVFDTLVVQAGDAATMEAAIKAAATAAGRPEQLVDVELGGAGAGLSWEAILTMADNVTTGLALDLNSGDTLQVAVGTGGNPADAIAAAKARAAADPPAAVLRVLVAGAGVGPAYMAIIVGGT